MKFFKKKDKDVKFSSPELYVDPLKNMDKAHKMLILRAEKVPGFNDQPNSESLQQKFQSFLVLLMIL